MKQRIVLTAVIVLGLLLGMAGQSLAQAIATTPEEAPLLTGAVPMTGMLTGSRAGSFAYYRVQYPGTEDVVNIRVTFVPGDPATMSGVGFNVYGENGTLLGEGQHWQAPGVMGMMYSSDTPEIWLVQVYNYIPDRQVWFEIAGEGLPMVVDVETPLPVVTPEPAMTPAPVVTDEEPGTDEEGVDAADTTLAPGTTITGTLTGSAGGSFDLYELTYPGDDSDVMITLQVWPFDPALEPRMGFNIYGPTGNRVAQATARHQPGIKVATLSTDVAGTYIVQVYNYNQDVTQGYTLSR